MNKVVIVTGASRGIGRGIAEYLARNSFLVIANYNKSEKEAEELKKMLADDNIFIDIYKADVSKREEVKKLVQYIIDKYGKIDVVINNAGIDQIKMFLDITDDDWDLMIKTNLNSVFYMCQEALPYMIKRKEGSIINISSIWGLKGASCESAYSVTKAGIDALTKSLAKELGPSNIRVNSIAPGIINTDMNKFLNENEKKEIIDEIPLQRIGKVEDVAQCTKWLIEEKYITGQVIQIDGGWEI